MSLALYKEELYEHYKFPCNTKPLDQVDFSVADENPSCGDRVTLDGSVCSQKVNKLCFKGKGCIISQASASLITEACIGKTFKEIMSLSCDDIQTLIKVPLGPNRMRCALLSLQALQKGITQYVTQKETSL